jgi:hypothetical protein
MFWRFSRARDLLPACLSAVVDAEHVYSNAESEMTTSPLPLTFITQRPREDGCGAVVLQMLTAETYDSIATRIGWREGDLRRSTWADLIRILTGLGWEVGVPIPTDSWQEITSLSIVNVKEDHFMLFDGENGLFYDPWEFEGPQQVTTRVPNAYLPVTRAR